MIGAGLNVLVIQQFYVPPVGLASSFAVADFKNETYSINGTAVTLADMFVEDAEDWNTFDPSACIVNGTGLVGDLDNWPTMNDALAASMIASGVTIKATFQFASGGRLVFDLFDLLGSNLRVKAGTIARSVTVDDGTTAQSSLDVGQQRLWEGKHVIAFNLSAANLSASQDGQDSFGFDPIEGSPTHIAIELKAGITLEKLEFFTLQAQADLYAYSFHGSPHLEVDPVITPVSGVVGDTFTCSTGTWANSPDSYEYQWMRGDTTASIVIDDGPYAAGDVWCFVTAINAEGEVISPQITAGPVTA